MFTFEIANSSAIDQISVSPEKKIANITFKGGREYAYELPEPDAFIQKLTEQMEDKENGSVGRFVNTAIREDMIKPITI